MTSDNPQENPETKSVGLSNATERYLPKTSDASKTDDIKDFKTRRSEARKDINNAVAALLALALWAVLIFTIIRHLEATISFSKHLFSSDTPLELEKVQSAVAMVNDTAKTLYSFLGTLVTAVTAYYFKTLLDSSNNNDSKDT
ncbi:hypothetical protein [Aphanothece sacrum]|uniref:Membrane protein n=1 Tax=Aphanothece sacrum FPU1 TaxID=1920663 RepID=A0A401ICT3_APHSA|nr:hypothetical protein [Aphanothece sacrum]GBF78999.1 membrane protein [Aphanothece sacrum FPU1]GBF84448.1 hypothetical protein AsFPU3_1497 [Aphanothece sacrum FPU3]